MRPSAPTAIAARETAPMRLCLPVPCDGSATTGKCESSFARATAAKSKVLRMPVSNVLIPRSQRTTSEFPPESRYSAASSHSFTDADGPATLNSPSLSPTTATPGPVRPRLAADELKGVGDRDHVVDSGRDRKSLDFMAAAAAAHRRDNRAFGTARDVRLKAGFPDTLNDVFNLLFGGVVGHVHNHGDDLSSCRQKQKPRFLSRLRRNP